MNTLRDTYNNIAKDWHADHREDDWWHAGTDAFISYLKPGQRVLDGGCAGGMKSKYLLEKGLQVVGIDLSENFIAIAKKEVPGAEFFVKDLRDIDTVPGIFDGIFIQAVLLHIPKKEIPGIIKAAIEKLTPGGYLYVAVKEKHEGGPDEEIKKENDYGYEYERFFSYFTLEEFEAYFTQAGLDIVYTDRKDIWIQIIGKKKA